jgi:aspartate-semialdehyde dehydrogenase
VAAHPAAIILALLLLRAQKAGVVARAVTTVFEPASERGQKGMDELHQQTVNLLSFQPLPKDVFDVQVAFNMVARYGQKSQPPLDSLEARVLRHYQNIAGAAAPNPSLMLLQAPIFHGHALSVFLEMAEKEMAQKGMAGKMPPQDLALALAGDHVVVPGAEDDPPSNVSAAGQTEIVLEVSAASADEQPAAGTQFWLWMAADNLKLAALNAIACASELRRLRPHGKVQ